MIKVSGETLRGVVATIQDVAEVWPVFKAAYDTLFGIWKADHPSGTFDDFNAHLRASADAEVDFTSRWLLAHGYEKDGSGGWRKVATS